MLKVVHQEVVWRLGFYFWISDVFPLITSVILSKKYYNKPPHKKQTFLCVFHNIFFSVENPLVKIYVALQFFFFFVIFWVDNMINSALVYLFLFNISIFVVIFWVDNMMNSELVYLFLFVISFSSLSKLSGRHNMS